MDSTWIAALLSVVAAIVSGLFAFVVSKSNNKNQTILLERRRKETQYYALIEKLIKARADAHEADELSALVQQIYLVGSPVVVRAMNRFLSVFTEERTGSSQDELYAALIKAMREDLYGQDMNIGFPDEVKLTVFK